jgi:hypothetical protein
MEDIINKQNGKVQVIFEKTDGTVMYRDALWFSQEEYDITTPEQISTMQQERYNNWLAVIIAMPTEEVLITEPEIIVSSQE